MRTFKPYSPSYICCGYPRPGALESWLRPGLVRMTECVVCGVHATQWGEHIHTREHDIVTAGWCDTPHESVMACHGYRETLPVEPFVWTDDGRMVQYEEPTA